YVASFSSSIYLHYCEGGAWILTNGLRFGITKHLGQAVRDHSLASTSSKVRVVAIGIAPWNMIHNREALRAGVVGGAQVCSTAIVLHHQIKCKAFTGPAVRS
uniref:TRPM SLOG domain-containing protein n=1 Tax=Stegastes partitus TaxID=144197 RepID=A0A3B4ZXU8_9TELE